MAYKRLGDLLIDAGVITQEQLEEGLARQKQTKERLGTALINGGIIIEQQLIDALQLQLGIDYVDLSHVNIPVELANLVPRNIATQYQVVPVKLSLGEIYLAMSDPMNFYAIEEVRKSARKKVVPMIAGERAVERAIQILYGNVGAAKAIEEMKMEAAANGNASDTERTGFTAMQLEETNDANAPTVRLVNSILERAINERASDIHLEPREQDMFVRMRIDGMMRRILTVPKNLQSSVISRLKVMSGMDIAERRVPQDGRFNVRVKDKDVDLRVSTLPTIYGEKIVARLLEKSGSHLTKEAIGLSGEDLRKYEKLLLCNSGVILIAGPTGSGKSSTMYTMVGELNTDEVNLVTLEDPVEYNVDGVNQVQINEKIGMTFEYGLRSVLRQDPDIIAVGEIRDGDTAEIAMRAAITGHVVLSTIHTTDAVGTIERLVDIGVEPYLISSALRGVVSQRLVRRICPKCKKEYTPERRILEQAGLTDQNIRYYRGEGCSDCFHTGYRGRIAVFEILTVGGKIRSLISSRAGRDAIEEVLNGKDGDYVSMRENGFRLVREGITTLEEVLRVTAEQE